MSNSPDGTAVEEVNLNLLPGSGEAQHNSNSLTQVVTGQSATYCCNDRHHRKLAICSIICGISCIGIKALINSVKAEEATDPEEATEFSRRARKFGIISIVTWFIFLTSIPILMALISYLLTLRD
uniref:Uncharacterized protein n=1 Tax=Mola mola TaxID=94237 RepID=A0A3Q4BP65_MOLML